MKDLSFFLLKNSLGAKMRKGVKNFCNGDGSTSIVDQQNPNTNPSYHHHHHHTPSVMISSPCKNLNNKNTYMEETASAHSPPPTLEQMILQLELEEEIARKAKRDTGGQMMMMMRGRMSCVNNSDILRSARNALNQYPRFSLDGKDSMYQSSFRNTCLDSFGKLAAGRRNSASCDHDHGLVTGERIPTDSNKFGIRNASVDAAGESRVVWCKPGVVAKLMGLEVMPVPINSRCRSSSESTNSKETMSSIIKRQKLRRRAERHEMERRLAVEMRNHTTNHDHAAAIDRGRNRMASCSRTGHSYNNCVMKPVAVDDQSVNNNNIDGGGGWPTRRCHNY